MTDKNNNNPTADNEEQIPEMEAPATEQPEIEAADAATENADDRYNALNDRYVRLMAEYDNYRKRTMKEKSELILSAGEGVLQSILPVVDNFERALANMTGDDEQVLAQRQGVELIYQQLLSVLKQNGVTAIETENAELNTDLHDAIAIVPAPDKKLKGKVIDCTQKGYMMRDKVLRHAKVVVGE